MIVASWSLEARRASVPRVRTVADARWLAMLRRAAAGVGPRLVAAQRERADWPPCTSGTDERPMPSARAARWSAAYVRVGEVGKQQRLDRQRGQAGALDGVLRRGEPCHARSASRAFVRSEAWSAPVACGGSSASSSSSASHGRSVPRRGTGHRLRRHAAAAPGMHRVTRGRRRPPRRVRRRRRPCCCSFNPPRRTPCPVPSAGQCARPSAGWKAAELQWPPHRAVSSAGRAGDS